MSVEVERKFLFNDDTLKKLEEIGACNGQRQFQDRYFDTPEFDLTLKDTWLRKRKDCWELKCPTAAAVCGQEVDLDVEQTKAAALCTRYKEITDLPEIQNRVRQVVGGGGVRGEDGGADGGTDGGKDARADECWLGDMNLVCFAEFSTVRRSFTLEEDGVQIDLDQADFGYHVGEIEVMVPDGGDVQSALGKIQRVALKLGLTGDQKVEGKMSAYLKRHHPEHYKKLLGQHLL